MTPITLMQELGERISGIVSNYRMQESDGSHELRAPRIWLQHLPEKLYDDSVDPADFPFVLLILDQGIVDERREGSCAIGIVVAGYDAGILEGKVYDRQGWLLPAEMLWRIITGLSTGPRIGGRYDLQYPIEWELPAQDVPSPHWFGVIRTTWTLPVPVQEFNHDMNYAPQIPPRGGFSETIQT